MGSKARDKKASGGGHISDQFAWVLLGWGIIGVSRFFSLPLGWVGLVVTLLVGDRNDPFTRFWLNQMLVYLIAPLVTIPLPINDLLHPIPPTELYGHILGWIFKWYCVFWVVWVFDLVMICLQKRRATPILGSIHILD